MIVLGIDLSTNVGLAWYDTTKTPDSIECDFFNLGKSTPIADLVDGLTSRLQSRHVNLVVIEAALKHLPRYDKTPDLAGPQEAGMSPQVMADLNEYMGAGRAVCLMMGIRHVTVRPQTWQKITPKLSVPLKGVKLTKARASAFCDQLRIKSATNEHKRDAACIAVWAAGHAQELKMMEAAHA